ncbi:4-hydroxyphenylpyruvate dioxygenase-like protein [Lineus longissimus]|uniref:4-hydroxyphenylpyruvate dioxygenase-like protein n=1 Tax=Lineus longissimus TaxID=88925 RepID=UPI002B4ECD76
MAARLLHHVEIGVKNGLETVHKFIIRYKFRPVACRENDISKQWLLLAGSTRFVVTEAKKCWPSRSILYAGSTFYATPCKLHNKSCQKGDDVSSDSKRTKLVASLQDSKENSYDYICHWHSGQEQNTAIKAEDDSIAIGNSGVISTGLEHADSVFNVALEVNNVADCVKRVSDNGGEIIRLPRTVRDDDGHVTYATIKSCVGNVLHTLIDSSNYRGVFLPGFSSVNCDQDLPFVNQAENCDDNKVTSPFQGIDHVAFALNRGYSRDVMKWYNKVFGMEKFKINRDEDEEEGFVLKGNNIGLRLRAMNYRSCHDQGDQSTGLKFVMAESLPHQGPNQVDTFLREHGGPGVQHIGLYSNNIIDAVQSMAASGASFMDTPPTYYSKVGKLEEIESSGEDLDILQKYGILLDSEADGNVGTTEEEKYLMQVFTKPLFDHDTFFLEIIQRCGATGFGAGNISALWRSVEAFFQSKKKAKLQGDGSC